MPSSTPRTRRPRQGNKGLASPNSQQSLPLSSSLSNNSNTELSNNNNVLHFHPERRNSSAAVVADDWDNFAHALRANIDRTRTLSARCCCLTAILGFVFLVSVCVQLLYDNKTAPLGVLSSASVLTALCGVGCLMVGTVTVVGIQRPEALEMHTTRGLAMLGFTMSDVFDLGSEE
eukprot:PhM_4_TR9623/c0_g1_i1/m.89815